jgi:hypothetical protein
MLNRSGSDASNATAKRVPRAGSDVLTELSERNAGRMREPSAKLIRLMLEVKATGVWGSNPWRFGRVDRYGVKYSLLQNEKKKSVNFLLEGRVEKRYRNDARAL